MHLMTGKRAIAAAHAKVHVHYQKVHAVDDARGDLFFGGSQNARVGNFVDCRRKFVVGIGKA